MMIDASLWNEIGNIYLKIGSHREAISAIRKAIEMDPDAGWFHCNLGESYLQIGRIGDAIRQFRKSLELLESPKDQAVVWNKIGDACRAMKDMSSAIRAYKKADLLDNQVTQPALDPDELFGDPADFLDTIRERLDADTSHVLTGVKRLVNRNESQTGGGIKRETAEQAAIEPARACADEEEETRPTRAATSNHVPIPQATRQTQPLQPGAVPPPAGGNQKPAAGGKTLYIIPDPHELLPKPATETPKRLATGTQAENLPAAPGTAEPARTAENPALEEILAKVHIYENITKVNPSNDRAWDTLGRLYKSIGRFKDAIAAYQRAIEIAPGKEVYSYFLGLLYSVEGQHELAVQAFQNVLEKNPDYVLAHGALAGVYHRMGQETKANHHITIALPRMKGESAYNRACFHAICGDIEVAIQFLHQALRNNDTTIEWIKSDPDLEPLHSDGRYLDLISGKEVPALETGVENYFSCDLDGAENQLLPILNHSLAR